MSEIHPNLKLGSHSSDQLLSTCARKYQIYKLRPEFGQLEFSENDFHLDFGKVVGVGTQEFMINHNLEEAYWKMFLDWKPYLDDEEGIAKKKTFYHAMIAVDKFKLFSFQELRNYELVSFDNKPAIELGFSIDCGDGFFYRGYLDMLLWDSVREILVPFEGKTTGNYNLHEAQYKNQGQTAGYKLVTDLVAKILGIEIKNSYDVIYAVYQSKQQEWTKFQFKKSNTHIARWIKTLLHNKQQIISMAKNDYFPMNGNSCYYMGNPCKYYEMCEMPNTAIFGEGYSRVKLTNEEERAYKFNFKLEDLITNLLEK